MPGAQAVGPTSLVTLFPAYELLEENEFFKELMRIVRNDLELLQIGKNILGFD